MSTAIETRIYSGLGDAADVDWLDFLSDVFRDVSLTGFINHGMSIADARRLVNILALATRYINELEEQQTA